MDKGILVAVCARSEWLLEGWWSAYSQYNAYPVCFVDLGMSKKALAWAQDKGSVIQVKIGNENKVVNPLILQHSPFQITIWMELNCQVLTSLKGLFEELTEDKDIAFCLHKNETGKTFDPGVIVLKKNACLMSLWMEKGHPFQVESLASFKELNSIYSWIPSWGPNSSAIILKWPLTTRKLFIDPLPIKTQISPSF